MNAPLAHLAVHSSNPYDPLQVPAAVERKFNYIKDIRRRKFAGMLYKVFESFIENSHILVLEMSNRFVVVV